ncbi:MAG: sulfotransferase [Proteobacteria bacterium]|nr:sulfotransferase [Pseudomonadota bacterium]
MEEYRQVHERLAKVFDKEIVFIVGATRWGTAWVQQCLDAHPEICCKGEGHFTDILFPMLARVFDDYNAQSEAVGNRLQMAGLPGNAAGFTFDDVHHIMTTAIGLVFDRWTNGGGGGGDGVKVICEKTPEHITSLKLLVRAIPKLKIVHVYRDGRDEAVANWQFNQGLSRGEFRRQYPKFGDFAKVFAGNWAKSIGSARRFEREYRGQYIAFRAEDLQLDTVAAVKPLLRFLGADDAEDQIKAAADRAWEASPIDVDAGVWKKKFDDETARFVNRECGELLKLLGYEV